MTSVVVAEACFVRHNCKMIFSVVVPLLFRCYLHGSCHACCEVSGMFGCFRNPIESPLGLHGGYMERN